MMDRGNTATAVEMPKEERARAGMNQPLLVRRELNNRRMYNFLQYFWPEVSNQEFVHNWHIEYLCSELEQIVRRVGYREQKLYDLLINVPPGTTKTITCSIMLPAWAWSQWYWMRFITASYSGALSLESAEYCRDLVRSQRYQELYPEISIREDKDTKSNFKIVKRTSPSRFVNGGNRYSTSVGGTLMGFHGDVIVWDDALNPTEAVSDKDREAANRWIDQTLPTRKTDKGISLVIGVMQRLHQDDPTGHILAKHKTNVKHICLPGEIRNYREKVSPPELVAQYVDELLDPKRLSWKMLKDLEADLGQYGYAGQIGQDPTPPSGGTFHIDHFQMVEKMPDMRNSITVRYWDKAGSEGTGTYTVGVKMTFWATTRKFLISDVKRGQWSTNVRESIIRQTAEADGRDVHIYIEQEPGSGGKESKEATIRNLLGYACYADRPTGDKAYRADPYSVQVNNGNFMLLNAMWNREFVEEHRFYPFSKYKDQVDAAAGAFNKLAGKKRVRRIT